MYFVVICSTVFNKRQHSVVEFSSIKQMSDELKQLMASRNNPICFFVNDDRSLAGLDEILTRKEYKYVSDNLTDYRIKNKQPKYSHIQCKNISYIEKLPSGLYLLHSDERNLNVVEFNLVKMTPYEM